MNIVKPACMEYPKELLDYFKKPKMRTVLQMLTERTFRMFIFPFLQRVDKSVSKIGRDQIDEVGEREERSQIGDKANKKDAKFMLDNEYSRQGSTILLNWLVDDDHS